MARVISKNNELRHKTDTLRLYFTVSAAVCGFSFLLWVANIMFFRSFEPLFVFPVLVIFALSSFAASSLFKCYSRYRSGLKGEEEVSRIVSTLPETYVGVSNVKVYYENKMSELDMVVVGPTGIFIVEAKNHRGSISGDYEDQYLTYEKVSSGGQYYEKSMYNPVRQVGTHTYRLSHFLRANGIKNWINSAVYFTNPLAFVDIHGSGDGARIFVHSDSSGNDLVKYILDSKRSSMSSADVCKVVDLLIRC